ncbi:ABC-type dipeptide/oligopeptide/nickel transport system, ATPase component [Burkholderia sp. Ch1-1]|uniref:Peptide import ATP-binding protein BOV_A0348 n=1 Tax=Paraburkholderia dioscoreae TaxID=2604047 RepID=A0A5Q4ZPF6_9BURK|nr:MULTISPECIES: ABC transporter ATP-binding protein [Paraburkholderia]EIF35155.1 ABC-type dipeptide/oligopeptide/nickel transport system, ATPase component [Burkholderia sp. Ch1-1]MDR8401128.1 ABC transporter ATP-binding protein [Paraburkholderia sp. USG1]VVD34359.1 Putative peptide import ATP-binding protein BOV_A0348 [Paraburkholderia dioscoreae]
MNEALLSIENLRVTFGAGKTQTEVLHGLDLQVGRGEAVGLVGESGSGKSVASLAVLGLLGNAGRISGGRIVLDGEDLGRASEARMRALRGRRVSMIFQDPATALNPAFTIGAQLADVIRAHRPLRGRAIRDEVHSVLARVGFKDPRTTERAYPHELSGGMKQRAMIAAAIVCEPALLLADEPTTALDVTVQAQIVELLRTLVDEMDLGLVFITHNLDLMAELCSRAVVLKQGHVVEAGPVQDIFLRPSHDYTRHLIASIPRLPVARDMGRHQPEEPRNVR